ncbi:hypothetical protein DD594_27505 [Enterobacter cloacae complex sp. 4DZ1-17B1]|nr:hypothetical protein DD594_27505 [Enterobacter cloacae complex sp. 4DZ1-17B1]
MILERWGGFAIGRVSDGFWGFAIFFKGMMNDDFQTDGKMPVEKEVLMIWVRYGEIVGKSGSRWARQRWSGLNPRDFCKMTLR